MAEGGAEYVVGVDVGGTKIYSGVFDSSMERMGTARVSTKAQRGPDAVLIGPGPSRPEKAGISVDLVRGLGPRIPILGVCLGHQAIAVAYGARVVRDDPVHGKRWSVHHEPGSGPFAELPNPFPAARYHSLVIDRGSLPPELAVTAWTVDGTVMAVAHRSHPVEGLQFHPESILTDDGATLVRAFLDRHLA